MKENRPNSRSQLLNFAKDSYLERTSRPIYAMFFLLPFIIFYEFGTIFIKSDVFKQSPVLVDSFVWLQKVSGQIGFGSKFAMGAPPLAVIIILIALQITSGKKWSLWVVDFLPMGIECILLSVPLIVLTLMLNSLSVPNDTAQYKIENTPAQSEMFATCASAYEEAAVEQNFLAEIVTGMGAGIYEELVFRLILICLLMLVFQDLLRFDHINSVILAVLISAALFSAHHHIDFISGQANPNDPFSMGKFLFRTVAGVYFAGLFAIRGFGITAGTHIFYNIIAETMNWFYFRA